MKFKNRNLRFSVRSESSDKENAECTGMLVGKWKLAWWLINGHFYKGIYTQRNEFDIYIEKI